MPIVQLTLELQKKLNTEGSQMISLTKREKDLMESLTDGTFDKETRDAIIIPVLKRLSKKSRLTDMQKKAIEREIAAGYTPEEAEIIVLGM